VTDPLLSGLPTALEAPNVRPIDDGELLRPGQEIAGRYVVKERLGRGGMGAVWRVHDRSLDEDVALKVILPDRMGDPTMLGRFREEVKIARKITHNNVCRVFDIGESGDLAFLTMELVEGTTLRKLMGLNSLEMSRIFDILRQIIDGVAAAHAHGIIHRDLKPENVLVRDDGRCVVADFGLAHRSNGQRNDVIAGTPAYMSPEQLHGEALDVRSDIFALGLMAFELFSGRMPDSVREKIDAAELPPLDRVTEPMQSALRRVLLQALAQKPQDRFDSATAFAAALIRAAETVEHRSARDALSEPEALAPTEPAMEPRVRQKKRPRTILLVFGAICTMVVVALVVNKLFRTKSSSTNETAPVLEQKITPEVRPGEDKPTILFLPFDNLTGDENWNGLTRSMQAAVQDSLRSLPEVIVIDGQKTAATTEAFRVRGSVQRMGDKPRLVVHVEAVNVIDEALRGEPIEIGFMADEAQMLAKLRRNALDETKLLVGHWRKRRRAVIGTKNEEARAKLLQYHAMVGAAPNGQHVEAGMGLLNAALKLDENYLPALVERAYLRTVGGEDAFESRVEASIVDLEAAQKIAAEDVDAAVMRCRLRQVATAAAVRATDEQIRVAREACQKAMQLAPMSGYVFIALARLNDLVCKDDEAIRLLEQSLDLDRGLRGRALNHLMEFTLLHDQINVADRMSIALVELQEEEQALGPRAFGRRAGMSTVRNAHLWRGIVLQRRGLAEDARREFELELASIRAGTSETYLEAGALRGLIQVDRLLHRKTPADIERRLATLEAQFRADVKSTPEAALLVSDAYSRVDPEAAVEWLERTASGSSCTDTVNRSLVYLKAGKRDLARRTLDVCAPNQEWERGCMAEVRRLIGD
jgi:serine/threonine protein kinase/tetratricopeptide (TPR) repeat protein